MKYSYVTALKKWAKRLLVVGLPLLLPTLLDLLGSWKDLTLGAALSLVVYGVINRLENGKVKR